MTWFHYPIYGRVLRSAIPFSEELEAVPSAPHRWSFRVMETLPEVSRKELLGEEPIYDEVRACLYQHASGLRVEVDDTGVFDLSACGSEIGWCPNPDPWWDFGRAHLLGRVLGTALHLDGIATLHGSAVLMGDGVVAFLAPKGFGKSTLALRLVQAGCAFVTDDTLPVEMVDGVARAWPGVGRVRLETEQARAEGLGDGTEVAGRDEKVFVSPGGPAVSATESLPLAAIYFLVPVEDDTEVEAADRTTLAGLDAVMRLMSQMKIGEMLGGSGVTVNLKVSAGIASQVSIQTLAVARSLERLPEVVDQLVRWHGLPTRPSDEVAGEASAPLDIGQEPGELVSV